LREELEAAFREQRENVEKYCKRWETRLDQDDLPREATEEFFAASDSVISGLQHAAGAEKLFLDAGALSHSTIRPVARRYVRLLKALNDAKTQEQDAATTKQRAEQIREWTRQISA
jgi:hypothetical protein